MKTLWPLCLAALLALAGCDDDSVNVPDAQAPIDLCKTDAPIVAAAAPARVHVNGGATLTATGGSGRYTWSTAPTPSGGSVSGDRYTAGPTPGTDTVTATDDCGLAGSTTVQVIADFDVAPTRATVKPGTSFTLKVAGTFGAPTFTAQGGSLASGGSIGNTGTYTAGNTPGLDLVVVRDSVSGAQVVVQYTVSTTAAFRASPPRLALPAGAWAPLETLDGTGSTTWTHGAGPGTLSDGGLSMRADETGTTTLTGVDDFTHESTTVTVRVLTELTRPGNRPQGRRSDVATLVTGDFDGDGIDDVALGVPESDLGRPQGGAVFIFKGTAAGLPDAPTWVITGDTDTAQLGAVMAAGDLDGDGKADLAISAPGADVTVTDSGEVVLYRIGANGPELLRAPLTGLGRGGFGSALAIADADGDGFNDLIVGSPGADLSTGTSRGVVDVFLLKKGGIIPDLGTLRLGGVDLDADGGFKTNASNLKLGRSVVVADLNGDTHPDVAALTTVNTVIIDGGAVTRSQTAVQVFFGRGGSSPFADQPDLFVLPTNAADSNEGTWRLGTVPAHGTQGALLMAVADATDAPLSDGGIAGNAGGALLYDLSSQRPTTPPTTALQWDRSQAWARLYGNLDNISAGRSFTVTDLDGDGSPELVLGAPYATSTFTTDGGTTSLPNAGRLLAFDLGSLSPGTVLAQPNRVRQGLNRTDTLGTGLVGWKHGSGTSLVAFNSRASTTLGDFTGRLDVISGTGDLSGWSVASAPVPAKVGGQGFGLGLALAWVNTALKALVGVPNISGPAIDASGNEVGAGQAVLYDTATPSLPTVLVEGAATPYVRDGGWAAFGGRTMASDVVASDFDGDGRPDFLLAAPNFPLPVKQADGGTANTTSYAQNHDECFPTGSQTPGAVLAWAGQNDGSFKQAFRLWAVRDIQGCVADAGSSACQRSQLGKNGLAGNFDFNGDGRKDLAATRSNGLEIFPGQAADDSSLSRPTMACAPLFSLPPLAWGTSVPSTVGDLDGDGCDEVAVRYTDNGSRYGVLIAFGFDPSGTHCGGHTVASWVRLSGDAEAGLNNIKLGTSFARVGAVMGGSTDYLAVTADTYFYNGSAQSTVLLFDVAQLAAKRPLSGERVVGALGDGLTPVPVIYRERAPGFGRAVRGGVDLTGDGVNDLVVSATGANVNGDGTGAVFVFAGGSVVAGPNHPALTVMSDPSERASFGQTLTVIPKSGSAPAALGLGAPLSYRSGTANGTAYTLPLDF